MHPYMHTCIHMYIVTHFSEWGCEIFLFLRPSSFLPSLLLLPPFPYPPIADVDQTLPESRCA